jgi:PAS domain S-box-containing protein
LMLIGAYRDNEVNPAHPLMRKLEAIRQAGAIVQDIVLVPLAREDLQQLVADSLHSEPERAKPLAQLIHDKTAGNPFFAIQFFSALAEENLLTFDQGERRWSWDLNRIQAKGYADNVVDLMVAKLNRLPVETVNALKQLSCLGNSAEFALLALVYEGSGAELHSDLQEALRTGLVLHSEGTYRFLHDRVQEAAYSLIPEHLRAEAHLRIGRLLAEHTPREKREEAIFEIVNQLNRGAALITSQDEREQLAELNLIAGKRAKASSAYASALNYLIAGAALLADDCWERRPELILALELHRAECEFLTGELTTAEARLTMLSSRAANAIDQATVACLRVDLYTTLDRSDRAVDVCLAYLRHLGIDWSPHPLEEQARHEYERSWSLLGSRAIQELVDLPLMSDAVSLATQDVLTKVIPAALFTDRNLLSLVICRMVNLSLEHGNSDGSCFAYVFLGMIAGPHFDNYEGGFEFGRLGYALVEKRGLHRYRARTYMAFGSFVMPWTRHVRTGRDLIRRAFDVANRTGDLTFGAYSCNNLNTNLLAAGDALAETQGEAEQGLEFAHKARFGLVIAIITAQIQLIRTLRGLTPAFGCFDEDQFDERRFEHDLASQADLALAECWYWVRKLQARVLASDYRSAIDASSKARPLLWTSPSFFETAEYEFYSGLCRAALCDCTSPDERSNHFEALAAHYRQLEVWAANCPENFENRTALVRAEIARLEGRELDAEHLYEKAIRSAHANGFVHNAALANELAARFYTARGFEKIANAYLQDARYGYLRWGADGKVKQLDHLYPHLAEEAPARGPTSTTVAPVELLVYPHLKNEPAPGPTRSIVAPVELLDLATVIKVSQAVSGEMVLEKLIDRLMRAAIEHAGAERGLLIVPRVDKLHIEAEATTGGEGVAVHLLDGTPTPAALPESVVRYVMRTREIVILDDASVQTPFSADSYVVQCRAHSILCLPLVNQTKLIGILYLENNLTPYAFTPGRVTVLKVLASQAGISLENSQLYRDLEDREGKIRRLVDANILGIFIWNLEGAIVGANEAFLRMLQYGRDDLVSGRVRWTDLTPTEWRERDERGVTELKGTGTVQPYEKEFLRKDGSRVPVLIGAALFKESGREGVAFVLDLSDQKRAEAEIKALKEQLYRENLALRDEVDRASMFEEIVGTSKQLKTVLARIAKVAPTDSTVLITGETGTGKELIARAVHKRSQRSGHAFVSVNCAALAPSLISSELFGHEKGAFTGAVQRRLGRFEMADGGTIFLDEVGELLPDTQAALLRVLQEREFERVGGGRSVQVDVRVIAATNRDLNAAVAKGTFRQDLFYRLNVFPIEVPPLRERKEDLLMLIEYFVQRYANRAGKNIRSIDKKALDLLQSYEWPGNIRELQNVIERSVILSSGDLFSVDELWLSTETSRPASRVATSVALKRETTPHSAQEIIEAALAESRGRVSGPSGAAVKLGMSPSTLEDRIKALNIDKRRFKYG